jgi:multidrug efflux system membrane fusion protein
VVAVFLLVVAAALFLIHRQRVATAAAVAKAAAPPPPLPVTFAKAKKGDIGVYVYGLGTVTPVYTDMVKSRVDGQLMQVNYREGQLVKAGDSLAEIDPRPYQAMLMEARGQYARDSAQLKNAYLDLERYQEAYASNAIPRQQLDTQRALVEQFQGTVDFDAGQITNAQVNLDYCHITAPISGRLGLRLVDPGNIVHASDTNPLAVIAQLQPITVQFLVAEANLPAIERQLKLGHRLTVEAWDAGDTNKLAIGYLLSLDNQIDTGSGSVKIRAEFDNSDNSLFPNQFVNAHLLVDTIVDATLLPTEAIQHDAQENAFVYLVKPDQTVVMQPVTQGVSDDKTETSAVTGIKPDDVVAADNFNRLQQGMKVVERGSSGQRRGGPGRGGAALENGGGRRGGT